MEKIKRIAIKRLRDCPEYARQAAFWFNEKWEIPAEVYYESISSCVESKNGIPQWYIVLNAQQEIIAGAGAIENDFHERADLTPNLCALFVEKGYRNNGIAKDILQFVGEDLRGFGYEKLYLLTSHDGFYEKYGWEFLTMVAVSNTPMRMYVSPEF